mgnify:CR=1 FL=1
MQTTVAWIFALVISHRSGFLQRRLCFTSYKTDQLASFTAGALALGYANIFVTAPSPENLRTLFDFVFKGLDAAGYQEHIDYDLVESTNPEWGRAVVRINVFRNHRQVSRGGDNNESEKVRRSEDKVEGCTRLWAQQGGHRCEL